MFINGIKVNSINTIRYIHVCDTYQNTINRLENHCFLAPGQILLTCLWAECPLFKYNSLYFEVIHQFFNEALSEYDIANLSRGSFSFPSDFFKANNIINFLELSLSNPSYIDLKRDHLEVQNRELIDPFQLIVVDSDKVVYCQ